MSDFYPSIDEETLILMIDLQKQDPTYVSRGGYPKPIEELFLALTAPKPAAAAVSAADMDNLTKWERLEQESNDLFSALTQTGLDLGNRDNAEKMAYFRTATSLLDRIVGLQERAMNLKRLAQFQQTILTIMDDVLDGDQRQGVRERLKAAMRSE